VEGRWGEEWGEWEGERREEVTIYENESVRVGGVAERRDGGWGGEGTGEGTV